MVRRSERDTKAKAKLDYDDGHISSRHPIVVDTDDDDFGNEDWSLEIVQKAMVCAASAGGDVGTVAGNDFGGESVGSKVAKKKAVVQKDAANRMPTGGGEVGSASVSVGDEPVALKVVKKKLVKGKKKVDAASALAVPGNDAVLGDKSVDLKVVKLKNAESGSKSVAASKDVSLGDKSAGLKVVKKKVVKVKKKVDAGDESVDLKDVKVKKKIGSPCTNVGASNDVVVGDELMSLKDVKAKNVNAGSASVADGKTVVDNESGNLKVLKKVVKVKKKVKKLDAEIETVTTSKEELILGISTDEKVVDVTDTNDGDNSDNLVLRRLLRGPRYFDLPDKSWGACYNCGEEGHSTVNCTSERKKKPCFICGSLEHGAKQCKKGCFICKGGGHHAKDCPVKYKQGSQGSEVCLKCGALAHAMFCCDNDYSPDDLKEIQCYVCKRFGHLSCVDYSDALPSEVSCYKCGHLGHNGQECRGTRSERSKGKRSSCFRCGEEGHFSRECTNSAKECKGTPGDTSTGTPSSCFRCGEEGHFARECLNSAKDCGGTQGETSTGTLSSCFRCGEGDHFARECTKSVKAKKRTRDLSTPTGKRLKDNKEKNGLESAPEDLSKAHEKKKLQFGNDGSTERPSKSKRRGDWTTDDWQDLPRENKWRSPSTPNSTHRIYNLTNSGTPSSQGYANDHHQSYSASRYGNSFSSGTPSSQGYANDHHQNYSASRYGNSVNPGTPSSQGYVNDHRQNYSASRHGNSLNPGTPSSQGYANAHHQSYSASRVGNSLNSGTPSSHGYANVNHQSYSALRFGNSSDDRTRRNYDWW